MQQRKNFISKLQIALQNHFKRATSSFRSELAIRITLNVEHKYYINYNNEGSPSLEFDLPKTNNLTMEYLMGKLPGYNLSFGSTKFGIRQGVIDFNNNSGTPTVENELVDKIVNTIEMIENNIH